MSSPEYGVDKTRSGPPRAWEPASPGLLHVPATFLRKAPVPSSIERKPLANREAARGVAEVLRSAPREPSGARGLRGALGIMALSDLSPQPNCVGR